MKSILKKVAGIAVVAALAFGMIGCANPVETAPTVSTPEFSIPESFVDRGTKVSIKCDTEGAKIYYTNDGSNPTAESTEYTDEIEITEAVTIKAIAVKDGMNNSNITSVYYAFPNTMVKITGYSEGDFYISNSELTYARWYEVYQWATSDERGECKYTFQDLGCEGSQGTDGAEPTANSKQPVTNVSWRDAIIWCNAASEMENLTPYYYVEGTTVFTDKTKVVRIAEDCDVNGLTWGTNKANTNKADSGEGTADKAVCNTVSNGYRLPTEKEWEYAAKGGENFTYSGSDTIDDVAWYSENSSYTYKTRDVGTKKPNKYGLKDMSGNVKELCWDPDSSYRVIRGGSYGTKADSCAVSHREGFAIYNQSFHLGFRVCRNAE